MTNKKETATTASFNIEVPYKLIDVGSADKKPLIVYLHGFNQNLKQFQQLVTPLQTLEAYHLFIQAPYPIYDRRQRKKVADWGRAWYLYDGEQDQFRESLEHASSFIEKVMRQAAKNRHCSRTALFGYSMGGYLAGYYALSRPRQINDLIVIGGRIKTELFDEENYFRKINVLALHGTEDRQVESKPQKTACEQLSEWGAKVTFKELNENHGLSSTFLNEVINWFSLHGYYEKTE